MNTTATQWDGTSKGSAAGHWVFFRLISLFGLWPAYLLLVFVAFYYVLKDRASGRAVGIFRKHLGRRASFADIYRHFFSFGMSLIDRYAFLIGKQSLFRFETIREDLIVSALAGKKGAILLGAHIGNWELAGNLLSDRIKADIYYVMVDAEKSDVRSVSKGALSQRRIKPIPVGRDGLELMLSVRNALQNNGLVCMHGDRTVGQKGAPKGAPRGALKSAQHSFLGENVNFPIGPFAIAASVGAPIIPIVVTKRGMSKYIFKAYAPMQFEGVTPENRDKYIFTAMERYVGILEQIVKEHPLQWFNFYDFWSSGTA
jgi:predicted LPLAT superfamily acyltransferase